MVGGGLVEVIRGKGCSKLFVGSTVLSSSPSSSFPLGSMRGLQRSEPMSPSSSSVVPPQGPFSGLVICVTGLSKEARKQVMDATRRLGGQYSPNLHPLCTHLVVQKLHKLVLGAIENDEGSISVCDINLFDGYPGWPFLCGEKFEHALKHGLKKGLLVVTLGWFVDSARRNVRLSESLYSVKNLGNNVIHVDDTTRLRGLNGTQNSCLLVDLSENGKFSNTSYQRQPHILRGKSKTSTLPTLSGHTVYVDPDISGELRCKVIQAANNEDTTILERWYVGRSSDYVVCEEHSIHRYLGHSDNLVTPEWILKTVKERNVQRLIHMSADLSRKVGTVLVDYQNDITREEANGDVPQASCQNKCEANNDERRKAVQLAKMGVRKRRERRMQKCEIPIRPITPSSLLDSICWSVSEPTSTASLYTDSVVADHDNEPPVSVFDAKCDDKQPGILSESSTLLLTESQKAELVFRNNFLTILFPIDRFAEMGPSSRTFFSEKGFTSLQVLDHIYAFYQENLSLPEVEAAIHTDSRHADRLRFIYCSRETAELGYVAFKRVDLLGSRKSFEMLKRVGGDNDNNVYELLIRA